LGGGSPKCPWDHLPCHPCVVEIDHVDLFIERLAFHRRELLDWPEVGGGHPCRQSLAGIMSGDKLIGNPDATDPSDAEIVEEVGRVRVDG
jgi:hypothetical protein